MCLLIYKPRGVALERGMLERGAERNDDGWGVAALTATNVHVEKGLDFKNDRLTFGDKKVKPVEYIKHLKDFELVVHFRAASRGEVSIQNAHPIHTGYGDVWVAHNGGMSEFGEGMGQQCNISDTAGFASWLGEMMTAGSGHNVAGGEPEPRKTKNGYIRWDEELWRKRGTGRARTVLYDHRFFWPIPTNPYFWDGVQKLIGANNKVTVIQPGGVLILNRKAGWEIGDGVWVSNKCYENYTTSRATGIWNSQTGVWEQRPNWDDVSILGHNRTSGPVTRRTHDGTKVESRTSTTREKLENSPAICQTCGFCGCMSCEEKGGPDCATWRKKPEVKIDHKAMCPLNSKYHATCCVGMREYCIRQRDRAKLCKNCAKKEPTVGLLKVSLRGGR